MKILIVLCLMVATVCVLSKRHGLKREKKDMEVRDAAVAVVKQSSMVRTKRSSHEERVKRWRLRHNALKEKALINRMKAQVERLEAELAKLQAEIKRPVRIHAQPEHLSHAQLMEKWRKGRELRDQNLRKAKMRKAIRINNVAR